MTEWYTQGAAVDNDEKGMGIKMFDRLEDILIRFEEIMGELNEPTVTGNQERFRALMKEQQAGCGGFSCHAGDGIR